jgi:hypothetical protein
MLSALASLLPAPIKRLFEGSVGGGGGSDSGGSGGGAGGRRQRRRSADGDGPVIQEARSAFTGAAVGGTQGLSWVSKTMVAGECGDQAHGFIDADEVEASAAAAAAGGQAAGQAGPAAAAGGGKGR